MVVLQGRTMAAQVQEWFAMVKIALYLLLLGKLVIRSITIIWKGSIFTLMGIWYGGCLIECVQTLFCWHVAQLLTYSAVHFLRSGHQKVHSIKMMVWSCPGCPFMGVSWSCFRISCLRGTFGGTMIFPCIRYSFQSSCSAPWDLSQSFIRFRCFACVHLTSFNSCSQGSSCPLIVHIKRCGGRRVRFILLFSLLSFDGGLDNMSTAVCSLPRMCLIWRL